MSELKFLKLEQIKKHLHIEPDETMHDDDLLMYAESAEDAALNYIEMSLEEVVEQYGKVPAPIIHACLMRVSTSFKYREDVTDRTLYRMPYAWDSLLMPYMPPDKI